MLLCSSILGARQAVLVTPSKSVYLLRLPSYNHIGAISPLFATLAKSAHLHHSTGFSFPFFSCTYALFCTPRKPNSFLFMRFRTLCQKHPGWGCGAFSRSASPRPSACLLTALPPYLDAAKLCKANHSGAIHV